VLLLVALAALSADVDPPFVILDLAHGEARTVFGSSIALVSTSAERDLAQSAVRRANARIKVDGRTLELECGNYNLPVKSGKVQVDCTVTSHYLANSTIDHWGMETAARIRVWPAGSPFMTPDEFSYPLKQRWFLSHTQMANEPTYVDGEQANRKRVYYHAGLDFGGPESFAEVFAATDGIVVGLGKSILEGQQKDTPVVDPTYDEIYLLDSRGWYHCYSHLYSFDPSLKLGDRVSRGQKLGTLGKEGHSGGWSHLHFEVISRQPSGKWGTLDGFAFLWEAYLRDFKPQVVAIARPHRFAKVGELVALDSRKSYVSSGAPRVRWKLSDGRAVTSTVATIAYSRPGAYCETLEVRDTAGHVAYDFATVNVYSDTEDPITINASYTPGFNIKPGAPVTFLVRTFGTTNREETWDLGDGSPLRFTKSDGNAEKRAKNGYARIEHTFAKPGDYVVTVKNGNATTRLWVPVKPVD
jgi:murein DD-endopeptidase MepM/ murein hydrolase activator NlpD